MIEKLSRTEGPMEAPDKGGGGGVGPIPDRDRRERRQPIADQARAYFSSLSSLVTFDTERVQETFPHMLHPEFELIPRAERTALEAIQRNNSMADIMTSQPFREVLDEQRELRGEAAIGEIDCIDGRIATAHTAGPGIGVHEAMGACTDTAVSKLTGHTQLKSQTLERAVAERPLQESSQILETLQAHGEVDSYSSEDESADVVSNCGAMKLFQAQAAEQGEPFETDDLLAENFRLQLPSVDAITRTYNTAARAAGKPELDKVAIRIVYDTRTQGIVLGYGEDRQLFSTALTEQLEPDMTDDLSRLFRDERLRNPGYLRETFTRIDTYMEKEQLTTDIIRYLLEHRGFRRKVETFSEGSMELEGLTDAQLRALQFKLARSIAFQYLTGIHKKELAPTHPFMKHNERFQAITLDDGYGVTVGRYDPEMQVFAANTATIPEAVEHVKTKIALMDHYNPERPYVLFVCSGIAEGAANNPDVRKQARATVGRTFNGITQHDDIAQAVVSGQLIPVPAILTSRSNRLIEIPNLLR